MTTSSPPLIELHPYAPTDLELLCRANTPELMDQLGGVEDDAGVMRRHERYLHLPVHQQGQQFRVTVPGHPEGVGMVGWWVQVDQPMRTLECGWSIEAPYRGRGIASAAALVMQRLLRASGDAANLHAYPRHDNAASNAVCRKAGFVLVDTVTDPSVGGGEIVLNDWVCRFASRDN